MENIKIIITIINITKLTNDFLFVDQFINFDIASILPMGCLNEVIQKLQTNLLGESGLFVFVNLVQTAKLYVSLFPTGSFVYFIVKPPIFSKNVLIWTQAGVLFVVVDSDRGYQPVSWSRYTLVSAFHDVLAYRRIKLHFEINCVSKLSHNHAIGLQ